jgi:hypothetical protein
MEAAMKAGWRALALIMAAQQFFFVLFAVTFFVAFAYKGEPMLAETYGRATDYPALGWASWFLVGHAAGVYGFGFRRPDIAMTGMLFVSVAYILIAFFASTAPYGVEFALHSFLVGSNLALLNAWVAFRFRREFKRSGGDDA